MKTKKFEKVKAVKELKEKVLEANLMLPANGLVIETWGNVSGIDRENNIAVIKPSGVSYKKLKVEHLVTLDLNGKVVEGELRPSTDTSTHLVIYRNFDKVGGVVHTHSRWATIWAQAGMNIPVLGTTHADNFNGEIPCTRKMKFEEISDDYEYNTGMVIVETFSNLDPMMIPAVLVNGHGTFCWGSDPLDSVHYATVLEEIAFMSFNTVQINPDVKNIDKKLLEKHFYRKHGKNAYYGQQF
jgi:L-ribulose-5-phosphate 4-epimerase